MPAPGETPSRAVRVFLSSTFEDMHRERNYLTATVFPRLREWCMQRRIFFNEVDLRWGVPEEKLVPALEVCLQEVDDCRPFFVGFVGNRFGSVLHPLEASTRERHAWIEEEGFLDRSYTEVEMQYGVLRAHFQPERMHSLFYFRGETLSQQIDEELRARPRKGPPKTVDPAEAAQREARGEAGLAALKAAIRASGQPLREGYESVEVLGEWLLADLQGQIAEEFALAGAPLPEAHSAWEFSHQGMFVSEYQPLAQLAKHAEGSGPPLVITGPPGVGKSHLLAVWTHLLRGAEPGRLRIRRGWWNGDGAEAVRGLASRVRGQIAGVCGLSTEAAPVLASWPELLVEVARTLAGHLSWPAREVPPERGAALEAFASALNAVPAAQRLVLCLDGLNHLTDHDAADPLSFLPPEIPRQVRLVLALEASPAALASIAKRGWPTLALKDWAAPECQALAEEYARLYGKGRIFDAAPGQGGAANAREIAQQLQVRRPLAVRLMVDILRLQIESYRQLRGDLAELLRLPAERDLIARFLALLEKRLAPEGAGGDRVARLIDLLAAAREGLAEDELRGALAGDGGLLPSADWAALRQNLRGYLWERGPKWMLSPVLRSAARASHLVSAAGLITRHFEQATTPDWRRAEELPWQYLQAGQWEALLASLRNPTILAAMWRDNPSETRLYWHTLEQDTGTTPAQAYAAFATGGAEPLDAASAMAALVADAGDVAGAAQLNEYALRRARARGDRRGEVNATLAKAAQVATQGRLREAAQVLTDLLATGLDDPLDRAAVCGNLAVWHRQLAMLLRSLGESAAAAEDGRLAAQYGDAQMAAARESSHLGVRCRALAAAAQLACEQAPPAGDTRGREAAGRALFTQAQEIERLARLLGSAELQADACQLQGRSWQLRERFQLSIPYHEREVQLTERMTDKSREIRARLALAPALLRRGNGNGAVAELDRAEKLAHDLRSPIALALVALQIADVYECFKDVKSAERWRDEARKYLTSATQRSAR